MEDESANWVVGLVLTVFNLLAQIERKLAGTETQIERLNVTASQIADVLEPLRDATLAMQRAAQKEKNKP